MCTVRAQFSTTPRHANINGATSDECLNLILDSVCLPLPSPLPSFFLRRIKRIGSWGSNPTLWIPLWTPVVASSSSSPLWVRVLCVVCVPNTHVKTQMARWIKHPPSSFSFLPVQRKESEWVSDCIVLLRSMTRRNQWTTLYYRLLRPETSAMSSSLWMLWWTTTLVQGSNNGGWCHFIDLVLEIIEAMSSMTWQQ